MAPRSTRNSQASTSAAPDLFAIEHSTERGRPRKRDAPSDRSNEQSTNPPATTLLQDSLLSRTSPRGSCTDGDDADADISNAEVAEADEEDEDVGNGDVFAPSGSAINKHGDQAGRITASFSSVQHFARKRRASSASLEDPDQSSPLKALKRDVPNLGEGYESDDAVYDNVDLVSDSDEDDENIEKMEELDILDSEGRSAMSRVHTFTADLLGDRVSSWSGFDFDDEMLLLDAQYVDAVKEDDDNQRAHSQPETAARRVRFRTPDSPFLNDSDIGVQNEHLKGLFHDNEATVETIEDFTLNFDQDDASSRGSSSGYESDYGETTDEEDVPRTARPQALVREPSLSSMVPTYHAGSATSRSPFKIPGTPASHRNGPRVGTFKVNPTKPYCMIDSAGESMLVVPATRPRRREVLEGPDSSQLSTACPSPITPHSATSTTLDAATIGAQRSSSQSGVNPSLSSQSHPVSFTPLVPDTSSHNHRSAMENLSVFAPRSSIHDLKSTFADLGEVEDYGDDGEAILNIEDFIELDSDCGGGEDDDDALEAALAADNSLDEEEEEDAIARATLPTPSPTSPMIQGRQIQVRTSSPESSSSELFSHFGHGVIGAFRRGQPNHNAHESQAGPSLNERAIRSGRQSAANAVLNSQTNVEFSNTLGSHSASTGVAKRKVKISRSDPITAL